MLVADLVCFDGSHFACLSRIDGPGMNLCLIMDTKEGLLFRQTLGEYCTAYNLNTGVCNRFLCIDLKNLY